MRTHGYIKIPRSWSSTGSDNPFGPPTTTSQQAKIVALVLISWAPYHRNDPQKDQIEITYSKLSQATGYAKSSLFRAIQFLVKGGFLDILQAQKSMKITIKPSLTKYIHKSAKTETEKPKDGEIPKDENTEKISKKTERQSSIQNEIPGTENLRSKYDLDCCNHCYLFFEQKATWNDESNLGTQNRKSASTTSTENDSQMLDHDSTKNICLNQNPGFYISLRDMYKKKKISNKQFDRSLKKYRQRKTAETNQQVETKKSRKRKNTLVSADPEDKLEIPTDQEAIPENESALWKIANGYAAHLNTVCGMPRRRLPVQRFKEQFRRLQEHYDVTIEELREMVEAKMEHPFWKTFDKHPWTLSQPNKWSDDPWADIRRYSQKRKATPTAKERSLKNLLEVVVCEVTGKKWFQGNEVR